MPIKKRWSETVVDRIRRNVPARTGVYELREDGELVYIGRARNLRNRLVAHAVDDGPDAYRYEIVDFLGNPEKRHRKHYDRFMEGRRTRPAWMDGRP